MSSSFGFRGWSEVHFLVRLPRVVRGLDCDHLDRLPGVHELLGGPKVVVEVKESQVLIAVIGF